MRLTGASRRFHVPTGAAMAKGSGPGGCEGGRGGATYRAAAACQGPVLGGWLEGVPALRAGTETLASPCVSAREGARDAASGCVRAGVCECE